MTEAEWLACTVPEKMLEFLREKFSDETMVYNEAVCRKVRLFSCACCRRIWHLLRTKHSRRAVEVAERYADGQAGSLSLVGAALATLFHRPHAPEHIAGTAAGLIMFTRSMPLNDAGCCAWNAAVAVNQATPDACDEARNAESTAQAALIRDLFGNPFRPVRSDPAWLAWNGGTVPELAQSIYDDRSFDRLPILADALEDAGCADPDILGHCRGPGPHVRGCWAVDLLLGKE